LTEFFTPEKDKQDLAPPVTPNAELPAVLILGDSISQGYTWLVRDLLAGRIHVDRPRANCGDTKAGLEHLDAWLAGRKWDLIHFNWGLHDFCHRHPDSEVYGNRDKVKGDISVTPEQYRENLEMLVTRLEQAADRLVWASTTVVPPEEAGRHQGDEVRYNAIAAEIMTRHGIPTNDLYALTAGFAPSLFTCPGDVHFAEEGMALIVRQVAACIEEQV
jgi:lysophospholipase L1-like esterase